VYIPANATEGDLTIYSSGMDLVYHAHQQLTSRAGQTVFVWDGRTSGGNAANTGIYVFVLGLGNRTVTGKIALVRK
jgi:flagellar hook assembly protein FlgD